MGRSKVLFLWNIGIDGKFVDGFFFFFFMLCKNLDYNTYNNITHITGACFFPECPQGSGNVTPNVLLALLQGPHDNNFLHGNRPTLTWIWSGIGVSWKEQRSSCPSCVLVHCLWNGSWWSCAPLLALSKWWRKWSLISICRASNMFHFIPCFNISCFMVNALMFLFTMLILLLYISIFCLIIIKSIKSK